MEFLRQIENFKSVSVVGMAKNVGKTECLKKIIESYKKRGNDLAVTSIGVDGESVDVYYKTPKPELCFYEGMLIQTSETHFREQQAKAEIIEVSENTTALGRLITARIRVEGKAILSGASYTKALQQYIASAQTLGCQTTLIDGALSRFSPASPAVAEACILCTGLTLSKDIDTLVKKTHYQYQLMQIEKVSNILVDKCMHIEQGVWAIVENENLYDLQIPSALLLSKYKDRLFSKGNTLFVAGSIDDKLLDFFRAQKEKINLIVKDFTHIFASEKSMRSFLKGGGSIKVLQKTKLLGVCVNPSSPDGFKHPYKEVCEALSASLKTEVCDVMAGFSVAPAVY